MRKNEVQKITGRSSQIATVWLDCEISTVFCGLGDQSRALKRENNDNFNGTRTLEKFDEHLDN